MGRRIFYIGQGSKSWRDPRNWSLSDGGSPLRHFHARGKDSIVVTGEHEIIDLRGMPNAGFQARGFTGLIILPDGNRMNFIAPEEASDDKKISVALNG